MQEMALQYPVAEPGLHFVHVVEPGEELYEPGRHELQKVAAF